MPRINVPEEAAFDVEGITGGMEAMLQKNHPEIDPAATPQASGDEASQREEAAARKIVEDGAAGKETEDPPETPPEETPPEEAKPEGEEKPDPEEPAAKEAREAEEAKAAEKSKEDSPDKDLDDAVTKATEPHTRPKTRQLAEFLKGEAKTARAAQRALAAEKATLETELTDLRTKAAAAGVPKEVAEELTQLRQRVQELDAERDPDIVRKFDTPIERNRTAIVDILKKQDIDKNEDGTPNPKPLSDLLKAGLNYGTLKPYIDALEKAGEFDDAEQIREAIRDNNRLARDRAAEVTTIKSQVGERVTARTQAQEKARAEELSEVVRMGTEFVKPELAAIQKDFPKLAKPEPPLPTDKPEVQKFKNEQIALWEQHQKAIGDMVKTFSDVGLTGKAAVTARARMASYAVQAAVIRTRLLPALRADLAARDGRIGKLEAELGKYRKAGDITRAHSASVGDGAPKNGNGDSPPGASLEDSFRNFARSKGVSA